MIVMADLAIGRRMFDENFDNIKMVAGGRDVAFAEFRAVAFGDYLCVYVIDLKEPESNYYIDKSRESLRLSLIVQVSLFIG